MMKIQKSNAALVLAGAIFVPLFVLGSLQASAAGKAEIVLGASMAQTPEFE
jgi:hypothetical protein